MSAPVGLLGAGRIGAGWAARFVLMGRDVQIFDPQPGAPKRVEEALALARRALPGLFNVPLPQEGNITFCETISQAVKGASWVQESMPERLELKRTIYQAALSSSAADTIIASSSSGLSLAELRGCVTRGAMLVRVRPHEPAYLMPLADVETGDDPALGERVRAELATLGIQAFDVNSTDVHLRDDVLVALLRGYKWTGMDDAAPLLAWDRVAEAEQGTIRQFEDITDPGRPIVTMRHAVPLDWLDYNGHMTEARYLDALGACTDRFMQIIGCDAEYVAAGQSFFTAETHIRHLDEVKLGEEISGQTQLLAAEGRKMHLFHKIFAGRRLVATGEHMLVHVSLETRRAVAPAGVLADRLEAIRAGHARLPAPDGVGRHIGAAR